MPEKITQPTFQTAAMYIFIALVGLFSLALVGWQVVNGQTPNTLFVGLMETVFGIGVSIVSSQHGSDITNNTVAKTAAAQLPLTLSGQLQAAQAQADHMQAQADTQAANNPIGGANVPPTH